MPKNTRSPSISLVQRVQSITPPQRPNANSWWHKYQSANPAMYDQLLELVKDWIANGNSRTNLPNMTDLHRFLIGKIGGGENVLGDITYQRFVYFIKEVERTNG